MINPRKVKSGSMTRDIKQDNHYGNLTINILVAMTIDKLVWTWP